LSALAEAAHNLKPSRPPPGHAAETRVDARHLTPEALEAVFAPTTPKGPAPFYCFEPFKTLYVRRSGHTKPCCFADDSGPSMGNLMEAEASVIWQGRPFQVLREGILKQHYPRSLCAHCLKDGYGPRQHDIPDRLAHYRDWLENAWDYRLPLSIPTTTLANEAIVRRRHDDSQGAELRRQLLDEVCRLTPFGVPQTLMEGNLDGVIDGALHGWVRAPGVPGLRLSVSLSLDGQPWKDIRADHFREDLAEAGKGDGAHAFMVELADVPSPATIEVRLSDTDWLLGRLQYGDTEPLRAPEHSEDRTETQAPELEPVPFLLDYDPGIHEREILRYFAGRAAGRPRPAPPQTDQQPETVLVIAFSNRSGSNLLAESLAASGLVNRAGESFNFDRVIDTCERVGLNDLAGYLAHLSPSIDDPPSLAVKLSWDQLFFLTSVGVIPHYWPNVRFAWIMRDDLMAQALSHLVAERTGCWSGAYPELALSEILAESTPEDLVRKLEEITFAHRQFTNYFAVHDIEPVIVDYDDLVTDPEAEARRVLDRLGMIPTGWSWHFDRAAIVSRRQRTPEMESTLRRLKAALRR
jgi:LPS sulfotransferase NodH